MNNQIEAVRRKIHRDGSLKLPPQLDTALQDLAKTEERSLLGLVVTVE